MLKLVKAIKITELLKWLILSTCQNVASLGKNLDERSLNQDLSSGILSLLPQLIWEDTA
jgi:hypothetical protein